jgi:hypothetical protein
VCGGVKMNLQKLIGKELETGKILKILEDNGYTCLQVYVTIDTANFQLDKNDSGFRLYIEHEDNIIKCCKILGKINETFL